MMSAIDRERVRHAFDNYVSAYHPDDYQIALKITHTAHVASRCDDLARALELPEEDCDLAYLIGYLHDIGRFEQISRYHTFSDAKSVDHAALGADILFGDGLIRSFLDDTGNDLLIERAVRRHNQFRMDTPEDDRTKLFCHLIRDADKIDIIRIAAFDPAEDLFGVPGNELYELPVTPAVAEAFFAHSCVDHALKENALDYLIGDASLIFELHFPESRSILMSLGYHEALFGDPKASSRNAKLFEKMRLSLAEALA